jgi:hypothetical protein
VTSSIRAPAAGGVRSRIPPHLAREIDALGCRRALLLSTPEQRTQAERVAELLGEAAAGIFDRAVMHVPIETAREGSVMSRKGSMPIAPSRSGAALPPVWVRQSPSILGFRLLQFRPPMPAAK